MASPALLEQALSILQGEAKSCSRSGRHPQPSFRRRPESGGGASVSRRGSGGESLKRIPPQMHPVDEDCLASNETIFDSKRRKRNRQAFPALLKAHHTEDLEVSFAPMTSPKMRECKRVSDAVSERVRLNLPKLLHRRRMCLDTQSAAPISRLSSALTHCRHRYHRTQWHATTDAQLVLLYGG
jgi:hypothetical protein